MTRDGSAWRSQAARIVAVLGHELRNPLAASAASLAAASAMTDNADPRSPFLDQALADLDRLSTLLDGYLAFGCGRSVARSTVDMRDVASRLAHRHDGRIDVSSMDTPATVEGDAPLLERVFENLVDNAFAAGASRVRIAIRRDRRAVIVDVEDDGPGLPGELSDRVFEPFVSGSAGGSGVGLALVADVLAAHGGEIAAVPSRHGARFRISVPLADARESALTATAAAGSVGDS